MAVAAVTNKSFVNLDSSVSSGVIAFAASINQGIVVHIGVVGNGPVVSSVTDDFGNTYVKITSVLAKESFDYPQGQYLKNPLLHNHIDGECWAVRSGGTVTKITVTLTSGAKFAVEVENYSGVSAIGLGASAALVGTSAPSISFTTTASNSFVSAGFSTRIGLDQAATVGTLRGQITAGTPSVSVEVAAGDNTVVSAGACTVTLAPTNTTVISGSTVAVPATYAACVVELKA